MSFKHFPNLRKILSTSNLGHVQYVKNRFIKLKRFSNLCFFTYISRTWSLFKPFCDIILPKLFQVSPPCSHLSAFRTQPNIYDRVFYENSYSLNSNFIKSFILDAGLSWEFACERFLSSILLLRVDRQSIKNGKWLLFWWPNFMDLKDFMDLKCGYISITAYYYLLHPHLTIGFWVTFEESFQRLNQAKL